LHADISNSTKGGALISYRDPLNYFAPIENDDNLPSCITLSSSRKIFKQYRYPRSDRRLKACVKQIVGGAFSGHFEKEAEDEIIECLVSESRFKRINAKKDVEKIKKAADRLLMKLKHLLVNRISYYLDKVVSQLFNREVALRWTPINHCQKFCDSILQFEDFGNLFASHSPFIDKPSYLLSFVVRKQAYDSALVETKYDVPNGLTEEYLLSFRSGRHDDADIIDTLQDYWYDWGAFNSHLYEFQDVFPWDCTEAYKTDSATCGTCNLAKHVWAFPFDSWSINQHHLQKGRRWYPPTNGSSHSILTDTEWIENRFKIFLAQDALNRGAVAMTKTQSLIESSKWLSCTENPQFDRLKLGGIHRAQPFSHHFEHGQFTHFPHHTLAPWVHLPLDHRQKAYQDLRDLRKTLAEVPASIDYTRIIRDNGSGLRSAFKFYKETEKLITIPLDICSLALCCC
jgi:hypothetical protein